MKKTKILFVCKHNMFRSKTADAYFNKINKDKNIVATSAGFIRGYFPLNRREVAVAKEFGVNLSGKPRGLSTDLLREQNLIVIVADDVPNIFNNKDYINPKTTKIIVWKIPDNPGATSIVKIRKIVKAIMKRVVELNKELEKKK